MSASSLFLSYPCLKSVIKDLEIDKRKPLSKLSLQFRKLDNQLIYRVNCLKFVLKKGSNKAILSIDSVKWVFEKKDGYVVVKCSSDPLKVVELQGDPAEEFRVPWMYFEYFMNSKRFQICKLELVGSIDPFQNLTKFNVPFLKWTVEKGIPVPLSSARYLEGHCIQKLEFPNLWCPEILQNSFVINARKLIISCLESKTVMWQRPVQLNGEGGFMYSYFGGLQNEHLQVTIYLCQLESFIEIVRNLLKNPHGIGSFYKMIYRKAAFSQHFLWEILEKFFDAKKMMVDGKDCMTIYDDKNDMEINCYVKYSDQGEQCFRGYLAIANLTHFAVKMRKGTAVVRAEER